MGRLERDIIVLYGNSLPINQAPSRDFTCPYCNSKAGTMISRDTYSVLFTCFRVTCPQVGSIRLALDGTGNYLQNSRDKIPLVPPFTPKYFKEEITPLTEEQGFYIQNKFEITHQDFNISYSPNSNRYMIPLYSKEGTLWGWGARSYEKNISTKFLLYVEQEGSKLYYPPLGATKWQEADTVILVEDVISAMKVSMHIPSISILGTNLSKKQQEELVKNFQHIIIWLDQDTWQAPINAGRNWFPKPIKMKRDLSIQVQQVHCVFSIKDPKDLTHQEIKGILAENFPF